ncbi:MAG: hypothetical protein Q7V48_14590, partial [Deltaproteobacteria bacterium]|nr:hypothetical protein [Deltaproteobacteria bacterium]
MRTLTIVRSSETVNSSRCHSICYISCQITPRLTSRASYAVWCSRRSSLFMEDSDTRDPGYKV